MCLLQIYAICNTHYIQSRRSYLDNPTAGHIGTSWECTARCGIGTHRSGTARLGLGWHSSLRQNCLHNHSGHRSAMFLTHICCCDTGTRSARIRSSCCNSIHRNHPGNRIYRRRWWYVGYTHHSCMSPRGDHILGGGRIRSD